MLHNIKATTNQRLCLIDADSPSFASKYERDINEPPLLVLLAYSRAAEIPLETIIDDELELSD